VSKPAGLVMGIFSLNIFPEVAAPTEIRNVTLAVHYCCSL